MLDSNRAESSHAHQSMLRLSSRASHLVFQALRPHWSFAAPLSAFRPRSQEAFRHLSSSVRPTKPGRRTEFLSGRVSNKQPVRYCSCQRIMCRGDADLPGGSMDVKNARVLLPTNVKPLHYDLTLEPDFFKFTYEGIVVIEYVKSSF